MGENFSIFQLCFFPNSVDDEGGHDEDLKHVDVEARIIPRGTLRRFGDNLAISSRARPEWAGEDWPGTGTRPGLLTRVPLGYHRVPPDQEWTVVGLLSQCLSGGARASEIQQPRQPGSLSSTPRSDLILGGK